MVHPRGTCEGESQPIHEFVVVVPVAGHDPVLSRDCAAHQDRARGAGARTQGRHALESVTGLGEGVAEADGVAQLDVVSFDPLSEAVMGCAEMSVVVRRFAVAGSEMDERCSFLAYGRERGGVGDVSGLRLTCPTVEVLRVPLAAPTQSPRAHNY
ncbi:hypothetical protein OG413_45035 [Streptomyces sp. NBC_01433]|uniref:hypothetical protein n=1 Tax=Streptomyces sp. NBC_01433 TaxID=2903864 RepID=UPI00225051E6|nr:hypothetical protein [Streptomyces sp. NBC_01433]MCX4682352.1 hypothetical protein [Streptomyces sp. NBC_01433]